MPVALEISEPIHPHHKQWPPHKQWTRDECAALQRAGLIAAERYELIEGELIQKIGKNHPHMLTVMLLGSWLRKIFGEMFVVQEASIDLRPEDNPSSEPEPDIVVLTLPFREFTSKARPHELRLVAEVSSTTLAFDLTTKARLYARSGIIEYWVLDVEGRRLIIHRDPVGDAYGFVAAYDENERVATLAAPTCEVHVNELF